MPSESAVVGHYDRDRPMARIRAQLIDAGHDLAHLDSDVLAGVDEFHLGGRLATAALLASVDVDETSRVLDVGCGIGGAARAIATTHGCEVTGVDLTPAFVEAAAEISELVGLDATMTFQVADATELPFDDGAFDAVMMLHVGMNIEDKAGLFSELARVLATDGSLHVYDIMRFGAGDITFPVPWSTDASTSYVATPAGYIAGMESAGLTTREPIDRIDLVRTAIRRSQADPPSVNLSHLMGPDWQQMFANLLAALEMGLVSPVEIVGDRQR